MARKEQGQAGGSADARFDPARRRLFTLMALAPVGAMGLLSVAKAADPLCYDPAKLPATQVSMRQSLGFKPVSPTPDRQCGGCAFFTGAGAGCGKCALLSGGAVSANSVCDSWAAKG